MNQTLINIATEARMIFALILIHIAILAVPAERRGALAFLQSAADGLAD